MEAGLHTLRFLVFGLAKAVGQPIAFGHQSMSCVVHLLSNPGDLAIGFLLRGVTCSQGSEKFQLQVLDQGSLINPFFQRLPKSIRLLDHFVVLNAQEIIP